MHDFYNTSHLTLDERRSLLLKAKAKCLRWWTDKLDCSVSFARQSIEMSFDEIMGKFSNRCHFSVIHRRSDRENHLEVAFSTLDAFGPTYFLWIEVDPSLIPEFVDEFQLRRTY